MKIALPVGIVAVIVVLVLIAVDVARTPAATTGQCLLARRTVLPDICVNSCSTPFDCTLTRRPYLIFFTQAATCMDAVICGSRRVAVPGTGS
jgi:hypothetical protein